MGMQIACHDVSLAERAVLNASGCARARYGKRLVVQEPPPSASWTLRASASGVMGFGRNGPSDGAFADMLFELVMGVLQHFDGRFAFRHIHGNAEQEAWRTRRTEYRDFACVQPATAMGGVDRLVDDFDGGSASEHFAVFRLERLRLFFRESPPLTGSVAAGSPTPSSREGPSPRSVSGLATTTREGPKLARGALVFGRGRHLRSPCRRTTDTQKSLPSPPRRGDLAPTEPSLKENAMSIKTVLLALAATCAAGCAGSYPVPTQRIEGARTAVEKAHGAGADMLPAAELHLKLAEEQTAAASAALRDGDNKRAEHLLLRAQADAELAAAMAREDKAKTDAPRAIERAKALPPATGDDPGGVR